MKHTRLIISYLIFLFLAEPIIPQSLNSSVCNNIGFESTPVGSYTTANAVSGWSISSMTSFTHNSIGNQKICSLTGAWLPGSNEFSILSTPVFNFNVAGTVLNSPLGGSKVAMLNDFAGSNHRTRISTTLSVTAFNQLFQYAFVAIYGAPYSYNCCDKPRLDVRVLNCSGQIDTCLNEQLGMGCNYGTVTYSVANYQNIPTVYTNWVTKYIDLSAYVGSCVTIEFVCSDSAFNNPNSFGCVLIDALCSTNLIVCDGDPLPTCLPSSVNYCQGSNQAYITAPMGFATYTWLPPSNSSSSNNSATPWVLSVSNPLAGTVYSLYATRNSGCTTFFTYTIQPSGINLCDLSALASCSLGSSGSATAYPTGSDNGYSYTWTNATNSVIGNSQVVSNLSPGVYSVMVTAANNANCGSASGTVIVPSSTTVPQYQLKPYCGSTAYFNINSSSGNIQWYTSAGSVSGAAGTAPNFTFTNAVNGGSLAVSYYLQGCKDSIIYITYSVNPGNLAVNATNSICVNAGNGQAALSLTPATLSYANPIWFSATSSGTTNPYTFFSGPVNTYTQSLGALWANGIYSVVAFDGACLYSRSYTVTPYQFDFTVQPSSFTTCPGATIAPICLFSVSPNGFPYTYNWTPLTHVVGNSFITNQVFISPVLAPGSSITLTYSLIVTPTAVNCPLTKTISVIAYHPVTPTVIAVPQVICLGAPNYSLSFFPPGGVFLSFGSTSISPVSQNGVIHSWLANYGTNTYTYVNSMGSCSTSFTDSYTVNGFALSVSGNTNICQGDSTILICTGANSYSWSNGYATASVSLKPLSFKIYTVTGSAPYDVCPSSQTVAVNVLASPSLVILSDPETICRGEVIQLFASGALTYTWMPGQINTTGIMIAPQTTQSYSLIGTNIFGCTNQLQHTVNVNECVALQETEPVVSGIKVFPNPNNGQFNIVTPVNLGLIVYDSFGRILLKQQLEKGRTVFDFNDSPAGILLLQFYCGDAISALKLLINR